MCNDLDKLFDCNTKQEVIYNVQICECGIIATWTSAEPQWQIQVYISRITPMKWAVQGQLVQSSLWENFILHNTVSESGSFKDWPSACRPKQRS